jgi:hypothetical protein
MGRAPGTWSNFISNSGDDGARLHGDDLLFENNIVRLSEAMSGSAWRGLSG